ETLAPASAPAARAPRCPSGDETSIIQHEDCISPPRPHQRETRREVFRPSRLPNPINKAKQPAGRFDLFDEYRMPRISWLLENRNPYRLRHDFPEQFQ